MSEGYEGWAILELMGHRRLAGKVSEQEIAGAPLLRLDVFVGDAQDAHVSQFYGAQAIYCLTPSTEELCRKFALRAVPAPVHRFELPATSPAPGYYDDVEDDEPDDEPDDEDWQD